ncbi:MAG: dihydroxyacetone kinase subunit L [Planctomycetes bacterium]|nr:dihydroxyacetone kinase subunit L [Planctomycetota bacterium]
MEGFSSKDGAQVVGALVKVIQDNKAYLSEIDGAIGDGDHGINMNKGFTMFAERNNIDDLDLAAALKNLGRILLMEIGGSMGPIYGTFFIEMSKAAKEKDTITLGDFALMFRAALDGVQNLGNAQKGDKTLLDTLIPAVDALEKAASDGAPFKDALEAMKRDAKVGWESTKDMQAKIGRASRLGERSIGTLDAGATSCWLIVQSMADSVAGLLR